MNREKLIHAGIDYDGGVHRFAGKPAIYEKYLMKFFAHNELPALRQALVDGDYDAAFRTAHNMKGGAGNLSITALFDTICALVDALRAGIQDASLLEMCTEAERLYDAAYKAVKEENDGQAN